MSGQSFTKLFSSIVTSTIWVEPLPTRIVWITMLATCDRNGNVYASIPGLAQVSGVALPDCERAIETFLSPDKYSRTQDHEGRRIEPIDGGWRLLNYGKYRAMLDAERVRESKREHMRRVREGEKSGTKNSTVDTDGDKQKQKQKQKTSPCSPPPGGDDPPEAADDGAKRKGTKLTMRQWLDSLNGAKPIPKDDGVFTIAENAGLPRAYIAIAWHVFREYHKNRDDKKQLNWRQTFQNYVRMNYLALWRPAPDGGYELTQKGIQAEIEFKAYQKAKADGKQETSGSGA